MINLSKKQGKSVILGVTGSISAYKSPALVRHLISLGFDVQVIATKSSLEFVAEAALANVSKKRVIIDLFDKQIESSGAWHVKHAHSCDAMLIAPCSATTIGKLASGICDNALTTLAIALPKNVPLIISPAMDYTMWENPAVQMSVKRLKEFGYTIIEPEVGELSSGLFGKGRLPEFSVISDKISEVLNSKLNSQIPIMEIKMKEAENPFDRYDYFESRIEEDYRQIPEKQISEIEFDAEIELQKLKNLANPILKKNSVLITAGPTYEKVDAVRFMGNFSSGKMGFALAEAAKDYFENVILITGPTKIETPSGVSRIDVMSASEMFEKVINIAENQDMFIMSAAVADFTPETVFENKLKKEDIGEEFVIRLVKTKDILAEVGKIKKDNQILVGFALETENEIENGRKKMFKKNADMIVINSAIKENSGFGGEINTVSILKKTNELINYDALSKKDLAKIIIAEACKLNV